MGVMPKQKPKVRPDPELVGMHVRVPALLYMKLLSHRDFLRKRNPMATFSDAVRALLEAGIARL